MLLKKVSQCEGVIWWQMAVLQSLIIYCKYLLILQVQWTRFLWINLKRSSHSSKTSSELPKINMYKLKDHFWPFTLESLTHCTAKIKTIFSLSHLWETRSVPVQRKSLVFGFVRQASQWLWGPEAVVTLPGVWQGELHCGTAEGGGGGVVRLGDSHPSQTRL